jgi:membrane associated rhomboid family serine protease
MSIASILSIFLIIVILAYSLWKRGNLYLFLAALIMTIFVISVLTSRFIPYVQYSPMFWELSFAPASLLSASNLHTLITSIFLHASILHLLFNLFALIFIGVVLESRIGTPRMLAIFLVTGIIGNLTHAAVFLDSDVPLVGASGAILGLLGALARLYPNVKFRLFGILPPMSAFVLLGLFLLIDTVLAFQNDSIAHLAHIGGALSGFLIAPLIVKVEVKKAPTRARLEGLETLATTPELREILERIRTEDNAEVRDAWLERFFSKVSCPNCSGSLKPKRKQLLCENCGWQLRFGQ